LGLGDQALGEPPGLFGLGHGGVNLLVMNERGHQIAQQRLQVLAGAVQSSSICLVSHDLPSSVRKPPPPLGGGGQHRDVRYGSSVGPLLGDQPSSFIPRDSPISARVSLISLSD